MIWQPPCPEYSDATGTTWQVHRSWHDKEPGDYLLEVTAEGRVGVRGGRLRQGFFELMPDDDPRLPALQAEAQHGVLIGYRPLMRAIIRAKDRYIKVFRAGSAVVPGERCAQMDALLDSGAFTAPKVMERSEDVIVFEALPGRTLGELGADDATVSEEAFAAAWGEWSRAWVSQLSAPSDAKRRCALGRLPVHGPEAEAEDVQRWLQRWLRHTEDMPELSRWRSSLRAKAADVTEKLFQSAPDPLVWSHGDLHDKQIVVGDAGSPLGLLDFDDSALAEAARDLAILDARLDLRRRQHRMSPARYVTAHRQVLAVAGHLQVSLERFDAYIDACWLRLACASLPSRAALAISVLDERAERHRAPHSAESVRVAAAAELIA